MGFACKIKPERMSDMPYKHLGIYSDMVDEARKQGPLYPTAQPGPETQRKVREALGWCDQPEAAQDVCVERTWQKDDLVGEEISWSVGYGPRAHAWFFKPAGVTKQLPAVMALHDHGGFKYYGKEKIAEGPEKVQPFLRRWWQVYYGGRAWANALAQAGFAVLVPDTFLWGSRKFPEAEMRAALGEQIPASIVKGQRATYGFPEEIAAYNALCNPHEHLVSKYCNQLGTGLPGVISHEDRIALNYLRSRGDVQAENVAVAGLSGGGHRAGLLRATAQGLKAAVIVGLMSTYEGLLDHNVVSHTWMFYPFGWARHGDWSDLVACQAPAPLLVQYDLEDGLFTPKGMRDAHARLQMHYQNTGHPEAYTGQFYPGPHKFDLEMQQAAFDWLKSQLMG
jgi:dienelactone hydrolase